MNVSEVGWMTVRQLIQYHTALSTLRIRDSQELEYLRHFMSQVNMANRIIVPHSSLTLMRNSFCYRGATDWNKLPDDLRSCCRIGSFKSNLRKWIMANVPQFEDRTR